MHQPFLNTATAQLNFMSSDQLREIFEDDDKLDEKIDEILKPLENEKDVIITENRTLAESNLEQEPKLIEMRSRINDLAQEFKELSEQVQIKLPTLKSKSSNTDPESVLARVLAAAAESEEKSEDIANQFFDNNLPTDEFLEQFQASRMQMHLRKLKSEKMQELLRQGAHQGVSQPSIYPRPTSNFYGGGAMPYPTQPSFPMPMMPPLMRPPY